MVKRVTAVLKLNVHQVADGPLICQPRNSCGVPTQLPFIFGAPRSYLYIGLEIDDVPCIALKEHQVDDTLKQPVTAQPDTEGQFPLASGRSSSAL